MEEIIFLSGNVPFLKVIIRITSRSLSGSIHFKFWSYKNSLIFPASNSSLVDLFPSWSNLFSLIVCFSQKISCSSPHCKTGYLFITLPVLSFIITLVDHFTASSLFFPTLPTYVTLPLATPPHHVSVCKLTHLR